MNAISSPPKPGKGLPLATDPELTPGGYMKACRKRAGLSRIEVSQRIAVDWKSRLEAQMRLADLEANRPGDYSRLIRALRQFAPFPFDFPIFASLAAETCSPELESFAP